MSTTVRLIQPIGWTGALQGKTGRFYHIDASGTVAVDAEDAPAMLALGFTHAASLATVGLASQSGVMTVTLPGGGTPDGH